MQEGLIMDKRPVLENYQELFLFRVHLQARLCALMIEEKTNKEQAELDWSLSFMDKFPFVFRDRLDEVKAWNDQSIDPMTLSREALQPWIDDLGSRNSYAGAA